MPPTLIVTDATHIEPTGLLDADGVTPIEQILCTGIIPTGERGAVILAFHPDHCHLTIDGATPEPRRRIDWPTVAALTVGTAICVFAWAAAWIWIAS